MTVLESYKLEGVLKQHAPTDPVPLIFDSPHSGTAFPTDFRPALDPTLVLRTTDLFVGRLFQTVPKHGAVLLEALFPRAYIDVNRALTDLDPALLAGPWPDPLTPSEKSRLGKGLIWRLAAGGRPIYPRRLTVDEATKRIENFYLPYHQALLSALDTGHAQFGAVWHINCHSMKSLSTNMDAEGPGTTRPDIVLSDREGASAEAAFLDVVHSHFKDAGLTVAINDPFKGAEVIRRHGRPTERRHSLQVEINRRLYMNERTLQPTDGFSMIQGILDRLAAGLASYCRSRV